MTALFTGTRQLEMPILVRRRKGEGKRRHDSLPEFTRYRDDGCDIHDECLTCPLPRCRYEEPGGLRAILNAQRDAKIHGMRQTGASVEELAERFELSKRTIFRILEGTSPRSPLRKQNREPIFIQVYERTERREAHCA